MNKNTNKIIAILLVLGVVLLIFININLNRRLTNLESAMQGMYSHQTPEIQSTLWNLSTKIDTLSDEIIRNTKSSFNETVMITRYNKPDMTANAHVSFSLKEYSNDDIVSVIAQGLNGKIYSAIASFSETGLFSTSLSLPVMDNYTLSFTADGSTIRSGELAFLNLANNLCDSFKYSFSYGYSGGSNQPTTYSLTPQLIRDTQENDDLIISEISLFVESNGKVISIVDLLPFIRTEGDTQILDTSEVQESLQFTVGDEPGQLITDEVFIAKIVIYDHLGIRYEQADQISVQSIQNSGVVGGSGFAGGGGAGAGATSSTIPTSVPKISNGEYSWGRISIVDTN